MLVWLLVSAFLALAVSETTCSGIECNPRIPGSALLQAQVHKGIVSTYIWEISCNDTEVPCDSVEQLSFQQTCVSKSIGCPVACEADQHMCTTPPTCSNCSAVNYCSSQPCPVICGYGEMICGKSTCVKKAAGCPVECSKNENVCHEKPQCEGCIGSNWCSSTVCPVACGQEEVSCPLPDAGNICVPKAMGCPVNCSATEHRCHSQPVYDGGKALNWCSATPCPARCGLAEVSCANLDGSEFCVDMKHGCPVNCSTAEYSCYNPPACDDCAATNWCSPNPCPQICASMDEIPCLYDSRTGDSLCVSRSKGCPVNCSQEEYECHMPPSTQVAEGSNWCSAAPCPSFCTASQISCPTDNGSNLCVPREEGCPVSCPQSHSICHAPPAFDGAVGMNWCSAAPCPVACGSREVQCHGQDGPFCGQKSEGCPVNCTGGEHKCHTPAACSDCVSANWCSSAACPVHCAKDEVLCPSTSKSNATEDFCVPIAAGCPASCLEKEHKCHSPPTCEGCMGSNWCSQLPCPAICSAKELTCAKADGEEFCVNLTQGCPVTCGESEFTCHAMPQCQECVGTNWCSPTPCPH
mmetsp:Transcript_805/g.1521  ORF Transcript_805/g.1521 Transcript_805/m.1521 type:complete len:579 (-) Transcript_805:209-1945(-)